MKRGFVVLLLLAMVGAAFVTNQAASTPAAHTCALGPDGRIKHVIYIQFDNTHFRRDNPNVPSDLEQMPHLLNFLKGNGSFMTNDHTVLISHTATGILTSLTGVYPDRMGQPVSNSLRYFKPDGTTNSGVSFAYWTAPLFTPPSPSNTPPFDTTPQMINENGKIAPAPWVPYTRAGCDVGSVATANTVLENTAIDIPTVFGADSPEAKEVAADPGQGFADFVGIAVHCAQGSDTCSTHNNGRPDLLPDEPGGYTGFNGLFGTKYVNPVISPNEPLKDLDGNVIKDATGHIGFPGFDGVVPSRSLAFAAAMQEHGIPITYIYASDAHDNHGVAGEIHIAYGPGEKGYVDQLHAFDLSFQKFFDRLAAHGIDKSNTLFVVTVEEGDHFAGSIPSPASCDGVTTPCTYSQIGEVNGSLAGLLATQKSNTTSFTVHSDMAPTVYVKGNPAPDAAVTRQLERDMSSLNTLNPYTGASENPSVAMIDPIGEKAEHMVTADPARTPTFTMFARGEYFFFAGAPNCTSPCVFVPPPSNQTFAWNHGGIQPEIANTWIGYVGPGVKRTGEVDNVWTDHTDIRPTILTLLGLKDDYVHDGRAVVEQLSDSAVPGSLRSHRDTLLTLARVYKQLNAPFGTFGLASVRASTKALASNTPNDATYAWIESQLDQLTQKRDALAAQIRGALNGAEFGGQAIDEQQASDWIDQARLLIHQAQALGAS